MNHCDRCKNISTVMYKLRFVNVSSLYHVSVLGGLHHNFQGVKVRSPIQFCMNDSAHVCLFFSLTDCLSFTQVIDHLVNSCHSSCACGHHVPLLHAGTQIVLNFVTAVFLLSGGLDWFKWVCLYDRSLNPAHPFFFSFYSSDWKWSIAHWLIFSTSLHFRIHNSV